MINVQNLLTKTSSTVSKVKTQAKNIVSKGFETESDKINRIFAEKAQDYYFSLANECGKYSAKQSAMNFIKLGEKPNFKEGIKNFIENNLKRTKNVLKGNKKIKNAFIGIVSAFALLTGIISEKIVSKKEQKEQ